MQAEEPRTHSKNVKSKKCWCVLGILSPGSWREADLWAHWPASLGHLKSSRPVIDPALKARWRRMTGPGLDIHIHICADTLEHTYAYTHSTFLYAHTCTHTQHEYVERSTEGKEERRNKGEEQESKSGFTHFLLSDFF